MKSFLKESIHVPDPVVSMSLKVEGRDDAGKLSKAINRFMKEDPTFTTFWDQEAREVKFDQRLMLWRWVCVSCGAQLFICGPPTVTVAQARCGE